MINKVREVLFFSSASPSEELSDIFREHYRKEENFVRTAVYWMVRSEAVDDIIQETFLRAWKNFSKFQDKSSFRTWIYRIAMNTTYDYLKKEKFKNDVSLDVIEGPKSQVVLSDLISKALFLMSDKQREVFLLHYKLEFKQSEIAKLLKISEGTIKSRLFKAREIFRDFFEKNEGVL